MKNAEGKLKKKITITIRFDNQNVTIDFDISCSSRGSKKTSLSRD